MVRDCAGLSLLSFSLSHSLSLALIRIFRMQFRAACITDAQHFDYKLILHKMAYAVQFIRVEFNLVFENSGVNLIWQMDLNVIFVCLFFFSHLIFFIGKCT